MNWYAASDARTRHLRLDRRHRCAGYRTRRFGTRSSPIVAGAGVVAPRSALYPRPRGRLEREHRERVLRWVPVPTFDVAISRRSWSTFRRKPS
jgi:hypothetical protein